MKKLLVILVICFVLCGCSKEETPEPEPITEIPIQEITPTAIPTLNAKCPICNRLTDCKEFIRTSYSLELKRDIEKAYYLCDNCYSQAEKDEADLKAYDYLVSDIMLAMTDKELTESDLHGTILISDEGVSFIDVNDTFLNCIHKIFIDDTRYKTSKVYKITIDKRLKETDKPTSILDLID